MKDLEMLQDELVKQRECLKNLDESLKRLSGRDMPNTNNPHRPFNNDPKSSDKRTVVLAEKPSSSATPLKRKHSDRRRRRSRSNGMDTESDDDEADEDVPAPKHTLQSSVVSKQTIIKSKEDLIKLQNKGGDKSEQRNKRMFGMLLGTLQQFKNDDCVKSESSQAKQRKEIEKKIEENREEEKSKLKQERIELVRQRRRHESRIRLTEAKIRITEELNSWIVHQNQLRNFIRTKAKPFVYYLPKKMDAESEKLLAESVTIVDEAIEKRRAETEKEIERLSAKESELNEEPKSGEIMKDVAEREASESHSEMDEEQDDVKLGEDEDDDDQEEEKKKSDVKVVKNESGEADDRNDDNEEKE